MIYHQSRYLHLHAYAFVLFCNWLACDCIDPYGSPLIDSYVSIIFQTFSQLCSFDYGTKSVLVYKAPWCIWDKPRFAFRGLLLGMLHLIFVRKSKRWKFVYNFILECIFSRFHRFVEFQIVNGQDQLVSGYTSCVI